MTHLIASSFVTLEEHLLCRAILRREFIQGPCEYTDRHTQKGQQKTLLHDVGVEEQWKLG